MSWEENVYNISLLFSKSHPCKKYFCVYVLKANIFLKYYIYVLSLCLSLSHRERETEQERQKDIKIFTDRGT